MFLRLFTHGDLSALCIPDLRKRRTGALTRTSDEAPGQVDRDTPERNGRQLPFHFGYHAGHAREVILSFNAPQMHCNDRRGTVFVCSPQGCARWPSGCRSRRFDIWECWRQF